MAQFQVLFSRRARNEWLRLSNDPGSAKRFNAVRKTIGLLERDPQYPSLNTHPYSKLSGPKGERVFESYAENRTPAAFRVFWYFGPNQGEITVVAITAHP